MKKQNNFRKILKSKKTTVFALVFIMLPFIILGSILIRDTMGRGKPVIGDRFEDQYQHQLSDDNLKSIEEILSDEKITKSKVNLKSSTLRVYVEVDETVSKDDILALGESIYASIDELFPIEDYFTATSNYKQYDLEIHIYNNVEDRESEGFIYLEVMHHSNMEEVVYTFVSEAKDPEFKEEVLEIMDEKNAEKEKEDEEDDSGDE